MSVQSYQDHVTQGLSHQPIDLGEYAVAIATLRFIVPSLIAAGRIGEAISGKVVDGEEVTGLLRLSQRHAVALLSLVNVERSKGEGVKLNLSTPATSSQASRKNKERRGDEVDGLRVGLNMALELGEILSSLEGGGSQVKPLNKQAILFESEDLLRELTKLNSLVGNELADIMQIGMSQ